MGTKIYSLTQCSLTVNECDWHILAGNDKRINSHCLTRKIASFGQILLVVRMDGECTGTDTSPLGRHPPGQPPSQADTTLNTPLPPDGHCSGWYASFWNAFLCRGCTHSSSQCTIALARVLCFLIPHLMAF